MRPLPQQPPLELALSVIPSLPRAQLARFVARAIERLDELDGDPDAEDDTEDRCPSGDDDTPGRFLNVDDGYPGDPDDREEVGGTETRIWRY